MTTYTITWNDGSDDWSNTNAWSPKRLPGSSDIVGINTASDETITMDSTTAKVASLIVGSHDVFNLSGGTLTISSSASFGNQLWVSDGTLNLGSLNVTAASFDQSGGLINGSGTLTISGGATFDGSGEQKGTGTTLLKGATAMAAGVALSGGRTLENQGAFDWTDGEMDFGSSSANATFKNDAGATFTIETDNWLYAINGTTKFQNYGAVIKKSTSGVTNVNVQFINQSTGTLHLRTGEMDLDGGGSSVASAINLDTGTTLEFGGDGTTFALTAGTIAGKGLTKLDGATLALSTNAVTVGAFEQDDGTISGSSTFTITGTATLGGSNSYHYGSGSTVLQGSTTIDDSIALNGGRTLENAGTLVWKDGEIDFGYDPNTDSRGGTAKIENDAGKTFNIKCDNQMWMDGGTVAFLNDGLLEKTTTSGTTEISIPFTNTGTVSVQTGTLDVDGGGTLDPDDITVWGGAKFEFGGGTFNLGAGTFLGNGTVSMTNGKFALGANAVSISVFDMERGEINGTGTLTVTGKMTFGNDGWNYFSNTGTMLLKGTTDLSGDIALDHGAVLENKGTLTWNDGSIRFGYNPNATNAGNATLENDSGATFNIHSDATMYDDKGTTSFVNAGTITKSNSTGTTDIQVPFTNTGTVTVKTGTLEIDNRASGSGTFAVWTGTSLIVDSSGISGADTISVTDGGGTSTLTGGSGADTFNFLGNFSVADEIDGGDGTDTLNLNGDYSAGKTFTDTTIANIENLVLAAGYSYKFTSSDGNVASGATLKVNAGALGASNTLTFNGAAEADGKFSIVGGAGNDTLTGGAGSDTFDLSKGGIDVVKGGGGKDTFNFGAAMTSSDKIDGGSSTDTLNLNGDYSGGLSFGSTTMLNVEKIVVAAGNSYKLTTNDATVASGGSLTVDASALASANRLLFNGVAETNGKFVITGGAGNDTLVGGAGADTIAGGDGTNKLTGGGGADLLSGGAGTDTYIYGAAGDSSSTAYDTITGFDGSHDKLDLWITVAQVDTWLTTGSLSTSTFDADLTSDLSGHLTKYGAILFTPNGGGLSGQTFLIVDCNNDGKYSAGSDLVINLSSGTNLSKLALPTFT